MKEKSKAITVREEIEGSVKLVMGTLGFAAFLIICILLIP